MASGQVPYRPIYSDNKLYIASGNAVLYLRKEYFSLLGGRPTYNGSCILQGYVDEKRLKTPDLDYRLTKIATEVKIRISLWNGPLSNMEK